MKIIPISVDKLKNYDSLVIDETHYFDENLTVYGNDRHYWYSISDIMTLLLYARDGFNYIDTEYSESSALKENEHCCGKNDD